MDTIQILGKAGGLVWRYRAVCLLGAALIGASMIYPKLRINQKTGDGQRTRQALELREQGPVHTALILPGGLLHRRLTGYGCLV